MGDGWRERFCGRLICGTLVYWKTLVIILTPLALMPLPICINTESAYCGYVLILMAVYWITEAIPLAATALMPFFLLPMFGLVEAKTVASKFLADSSITFMGGMIIALAVEKSELHKRLALKLLTIVGAKPSNVAIGLMLPTWFLSMWISNSAATAMMIAIVQSVTERLKEGVIQRRLALRKQATTNQGFSANDENDNQGFSANDGNDNQGFSANDGNDNQGFSANDENEDQTYFGNETVSKSDHSTNDSVIKKSISESLSSHSTLHSDTCSVHMKSCEDSDLELSAMEKEEDRRMDQFAKMMCLVTSYSANIGGLATLTGTPTNLLVAEAANGVFESRGLDPPLTYTTWLIYGLPNSVICLIFMWAWLQLYFLSWRSFCCCCKMGAVLQEDKSISEMVEMEYKKLGRISYYEISALISLILVVVLWFARDPGFAPGYADLFKTGYVSDAVPAMIVTVLLFIFPAERPRFTCFRKGGEKPVSSPALLDWRTVSTKLSWGPIFILGGGYSLAYACETSGLSEFIGDQLKVLDDLPTWVMVMLITTLVTFFTEITSNSAVISIVNPILVAMAAELNLNPLYLLLPSGMAASCAFMLPVATPPNAIVFSYGHLKVLDMAKVGLILNVLCILIITMGIHTWGMAYFNVDELPWPIENSTFVTQPLTSSLTNLL